MRPLILWYSVTMTLSHLWVRSDGAWQKMIFYLTFRPYFNSIMKRWLSTWSKSSTFSTSIDISARSNGHLLWVIGGLGYSFGLDMRTRLFFGNKSSIQRHYWRMLYSTEMLTGSSWNEDWQECSWMDLIADLLSTFCNKRETYFWLTAECLRVVSCVQMKLEFSDLKLSGLERG